MLAIGNILLQYKGGYLLQNEKYTQNLEACIEMFLVGKCKNFLFTDFRMLPLQRKDYHANR